VNCESGLDYHYRNGGRCLSQGKQVRTCTLKLLPGITLYEIGTVYQTTPAVHYFVRGAHHNANAGPFICSV